ncbi:hypothetical protein SAMN04515656_12327 [Eubacterium aggregans]|uniref:Uncharacterized protein n=1 Tax=Eubacterium aggregans TaxID=81409 RepID=A0A1H4DEW1_9FIRM|nr:hypothetical protein SAMN04515656_12327 [Eubacterium aggregans]
MKEKNYDLLYLLLLIPIIGTFVIRIIGYPATLFYDLPITISVCAILYFLKEIMKKL